MEPTLLWPLLMIGSIGYDRGHTVGVKVRVRITDISELGVRVRARVAARVGIQDLSGLALVWVSLATDISTLNN